MPGVIDAPGADAALRALATEPDLDLVVTDVELLPGADGLELTAVVRRKYPLLPVVGRIRHAEPLEVVRDVPRRVAEAEMSAQANGLTLTR